MTLRISSMSRGLWPLLGLSYLISFALATPLQIPINADSYGAKPDIITGLYQDQNTHEPAKIVIHDVSGNVNWTWTADDVFYQENLSNELRKCINKNWVLTAIKWAHNGTSVLAIYQSSIIIINYHPGQASDKHLSFGMCINGPGDHSMSNAHDVELLPDGKLAVAVNQGFFHSIRIFPSTGLSAYPDLVGELNHLPAAHSLLWDEQLSILWAVGNDKSPAGEKGPAYSLLNGYSLKDGSFCLCPMVSKTYNISSPRSLDYEWTGDYAGWWDGPHDMAPIPNERKLLITTDSDIHLFDIEKESFTHGAEVLDRYLPGFAPELRREGHRTGLDGKEYPRSDIKSVSINGAGHAIYVQAWWQYTFGDDVKLLADGEKRVDIALEGRRRWVYKSKWFSSIPGWPSAQS